MIPVDNTQVIGTAGQSRAIGRITVSAKTLPFLINAVSDKIYKDKPGAIVREYSTNAWDAHIKAKLPISDIIIVLPTLGDPVLRIRDFGSGLTMEEIRDIYCILGESTKRNSNEEAGQLGLGCKSGFAYGDSFTVTAWVNRKKSIYNIVKGDDTKEGEVFLMAETEMMDSDRTGIEIAVPIKIYDINLIHRKAGDFFRHWIVLPNIQRMNESEFARMMEWRNYTPALSGDGWELRPTGNESVAIMGPVAYPIDWTMLQSKLALTPQKRRFLDIFMSNQIVLTFPIGALKFTINREELEYTDTTYQNLENKIEAIFTALENAVVERFAKAASIWDAKQIYLSLFGKNIGDRDNEDESTSTGKIVRFLNGEFHRLEEIFKNKLFWNGVPITTPYFSKLYQWDISCPQTLCEGSPTVPCLVSYRKHKSRVKKLRCTFDEHNRITPYDGVQVVIIDGRNVSMASAVARYYLLRENSNVTKVHLLRFANDDQKAAFFKHYNFDTANFVNISDILEDVKEWQKANRRLYNRSSSAAATLKYIDIETGGIKEEEVSLRDLEDGGVFVATSRKNAVLPDGRWPMLHCVCDQLTALKGCFGEDLDRVYCIPDGKLSAKWVQKAKDDGLWVELTAFVKENVEVIFTDEVKQWYHYNRFTEDYRHEIVNENWMTALIQELNGVSPEITAFANERKKVEAPNNYEAISDALKFFGLPALNFGTSNVDYVGLMKAIQNKYPLLQWLGIEGHNGVDRKKRNAIVEYIKSVESKKTDLTSVLQPV